ncbi:MAG TPA: hypothetical protein VIV35_10860, partial [Chitinophagaceae bacterium]
CSGMKHRLNPGLRVKRGKRLNKRKPWRELGLSDYVPSGNTIIITFCVALFGALFGIQYL